MRSCAVENGLCEHACTQIDADTVECSCWDGYFLLPDDRSCQGIVNKYCHIVIRVKIHGHHWSNNIDTCVTCDYQRFQGKTIYE